MNTKDSQPQEFEGRRGSDYFPGQVGPTETIEAAHATVNQKQGKKEVLLMTAKSSKATPKRSTPKKGEREESIEELEKELERKESELIASQKLEDTLQRQEQAHQRQRNVLVRRAIGKREGEDEDKKKEAGPINPDTTNSTFPTPEEKKRATKKVRWAVTPRNTDERRRPLSSKRFPEVPAQPKASDISTLTYDNAITSVTAGGMEIPIDTLTTGIPEKKDAWAQIADLEKEIREGNTRFINEKVDQALAKNKEDEPKEKTIETEKEKKGTVNDQFENKQTVNDTFTPEKSTLEALQEKMRAEKEGEGTPEREKTAEEKLDDARLLYATAQKDHLQKIREDQGKIDKIRTFFGFGKKIKEDQLPQEIKDLKKEYDAMRVALGKEELAKFEQTLDPSLQEEEKGGEIDLFKRRELFEKLIVEEQEKLKALSVENLPAKEKGVLTKGLDWYLKQNKYTKLAISATVFGLASASGLGVGAAATAIGARAARGLAGMTVGQIAGSLAEKGVHLLYKGDIERSKRWESSDMMYEDDLLAGIQGAEKAYLARLQLEQNVKRAGVVVKATMGLLAGMSTNAAMSQFHGHVHTGNHDAIKTPQTPEPSKINTEIKSPVAIGKPEYNSNHIAEIDKTAVAHQPIETGKLHLPKNVTPIKSGIHHTETPHTSPLPKEESLSTPPLPSEEYIKAAHGDGGIKMFEHLKSKLASEYPDPSKAPAEVQDILKGDPTKLAIKYKFFDPTEGHANESAMVSQGDELGFNKDGYLVFKHGNTESLLDKDHAYSGKMFDSDHSGTPKIETSNINQEGVYGSPNANDIPINGADVLSPEINRTPTTGEIPVNGPEVVAPLTGTHGAFDPIINEDMSIKHNPLYTDQGGPRPIEGVSAPIKGTMLYHSDAPEWGNNHVIDTPKTQIDHTPTSVDQLSTQQIDDMANHQVIKDIDQYFGKTTMFGTHINGVQTETWNELGLRNAKEVIDEIDSQNFKGDYMFGEYVKMLEHDSHLEPFENERLEDFLIRATKYNILHPQEVPSFDDLNTKHLRTFTRQGRNVTIKDNDDVYN